MAIRKMSLNEWAEAVHAHRAKPSLGRFQGYSPGGAASELGVSRPRIHQLLKHNRLDLLLLYQDDDPNQKPCVWLVTDASIKRYRKSKPMQQQGLPLA
jgi:hypothetical protein